MTLSENHGYSDPSARLLAELTRYHFKKSPIPFNVFYQGLEDHILRELDSYLAFESTIFPPYITIDTCEHSLCFAFAIGVKIMRRFAREKSLIVRGKLLDTVVKIQIFCPVSSPEMRLLFENEREIFEYLASIARFETLLECAKEETVLTFTIPLYNEKTFQVYTPNSEDYTQLFKEVLHYISEKYGEK